MMHMLLVAHSLNNTDMWRSSKLKTLEKGLTWEHVCFRTTWSPSDMSSI